MIFEFFKDGDSCDANVVWAFYDYSGKADLSKGCWNPKRKLGLTKHFSD